jgi:iron complex transport system permease protein
MSPAHNPDLTLHLALALLVLVLVVVSLATGPVPLSVADVAAVLTGSGEEGATLIVREIRLPRTILAVAIGATLGLAGAVLQGLFRNPLADPSLFGAPQAAAAGAALVIATGLAGATSLVLPLAGIAGAGLSVVAVAAIAARRDTATVLLAGLAVGALAGALTALILNLAPNPFLALEIAFWLLGSLEDRSRDHLWIAVPFMLASWIVLALTARALRALTLGEDAAVSLGIDLVQTRVRAVVGVALGVGAAVSVAGAIGFVGLVAPHLVRRFVGHDPGRLLLPSALAGAALLLAADILTRIVPAATELKVGVVTALIGAPLFLVLALSLRRTDATA